MLIIILLLPDISFIFFLVGSLFKKKVTKKKISGEEPPVDSTHVIFIIKFK